MNKSTSCYYNNFVTNDRNEEANLVASATKNISTPTDSATFTNRPLIDIENTAGCDDPNAGLTDNDSFSTNNSKCIYCSGLVSH